MQTDKPLIESIYKPLTKSVKIAEYALKALSEVKLSPDFQLIIPRVGPKAFLKQIKSVPKEKLIAMIFKCSDLVMEFPIPLEANTPVYLNTTAKEALYPEDWKELRAKSYDTLTDTMKSQYCILFQAWLIVVGIFKNQYREGEKKKKKKGDVTWDDITSGLTENKEKVVESN